MKHILLATAALASWATAAGAADLPRRTVDFPVAPVPVARPFTWTGFYAGVNLGYGFHDDDRRGALRADLFGGGTVPVLPAAGASFFRDNRDDGGVLGGGQIGYNMQFGTLVAGVEADIQATDLGEANGLVNGVRTARAPAAVFPDPGPVFLLGDRAGRIDYFGTVRGRVGASFDRALVYVTGGLAWASRDNGNRRFDPGAAFFFPDFAEFGYPVLLRAKNTDNSDFGFAVGGGVEYAFTDTISAKIEGLYVDVNGSNGGNRIVGVTNLGLAIRQAGGNDTYGEFGVVRAGLNMRFGSF